MKHAALFAIGTELLSGDRVDTNSDFMARYLNAIGVEVVREMKLRDNIAEFTEALRSVIPFVDLILISGGLGPTVDDITREAVSAATGIGLVHSDEVEAQIRARFRSFHRPVTQNNLQQAQVPEAGGFFANPNGTAPGLYFRNDEVLVIALPGPPRELEPMMVEQVLPFLEQNLTVETRRLRKELRCAGTGESTVDQILREALQDYPAVEVAMLAKLGLVDVFLSKVAPHDSHVDDQLEKAAEIAREALGDFVYGFEGDSLPGVIGNQLRRLGWTLALAESCTGGMLGGEITSVSGSSDYFTQGYMTYSNEAKVRVLGVPEALIETHGAVSEPVALAMAQGAREAAGVDVAVSVTGIAGPGGGTEAKPVGTVWIGLADAEGAEAFQMLFAGSGREAVRARTCTAALDKLRRHLLKAQQRRQEIHG